MRRLLRLPVIRQLYARRLLFPVILVVAVAGVLVHGALTRVPKRAVNEPDVELPLPRLSVPTIRPALEKRPLSYESDYWLQLAGQVQDKIIAVGRQGRTGIMVAPGVAIASIDAAGETIESLDAAGEPVQPAALPGVTIPIRMLGADSSLGLALFAVKQPASVGTFTAAPAASLTPGALVTLLDRGPRGRLRIIPASIALVEPAMAHADTLIEVAAPAIEDPDVAAIVDLDGELAGISIPGVPYRRSLAADEVRHLVDRLAHAGICQAIETGDVGDEAKGLLGIQDGVLIQRVDPRAFHPEPSLRSGDILLSWDGHPVPDSAAFAQLYGRTQPGKLVRYRALRSRRRVGGATRMPAADCRPVRSRPQRFPALGLALEWGETAWIVRRVTPGSPAAEAGLQPGDRITGAGGRDFNRRDASVFRRFATLHRPLLLAIQRGSRLDLVVATPKARGEE